MKFRIYFKVLVYFTYRALHGPGPVYISDLLNPYITAENKAGWPFEVVTLRILLHSRMKLREMRDINIVVED